MDIFHMKIISIYSINNYLLHLIMAHALCVTCLLHNLNMNAKHVQDLVIIVKHVKMRLYFYYSDKKIFN
jgi:hypothetical protein